MIDKIKDHFCIFSKVITHLQQDAFLGVAVICELVRFRFNKYRNYLILSITIIKQTVCSSYHKIVTVKGIGSLPEFSLIL